MITKLTKNPEYRMFDILFDTLPASHKQILSTQYRMIENIGNLISTVFYNGAIDTGCKNEDKLHGLSRYKGNSIIWFDTSENPKRRQKKDLSLRAGTQTKSSHKNMIFQKACQAILNFTPHGKRQAIRQIR